MRHTFVTLLAAVGVAISAAQAHAAAPQKGATLVGTIRASPFAMTVTVNVSRSGTISSLSYLCGTGRAPPRAYNVPVAGTGHFAYGSNLGDWKLLGHFVTPTTAFVSLNSVACGGGKGSTTLHVKTNDNAP